MFPMSSEKPPGAPTVKLAVLMSPAGRAIVEMASTTPDPGRPDQERAPRQARSVASRHDGVRGSHQRWLGCALSGGLRIERRFGAQLQPQGIKNPENGVQRGIALPRERLVEAFPGQAGIAGNLRHPPGTGDVAQRLGDERGVAGRLLHAGFQIRRPFLRACGGVRRRRKGK